MPFTYTKIAPYVLNDLWAYQDINEIQDNSRYLVEDVLGLNGSETELAGITLDKGATHGGRVHFNEDTNAYIECNSAGTEITFYGMNFGREPKGAYPNTRVSLPFFNYTTFGSSDNYLLSESSNYTGYKMPRDGSIVGIGVSAYGPNNDTFSLRAEAHVNGIGVFNSSVISWSGTQGTRETHSTQAAGTDNFSIDDFIDVYINYTSGGNVVYLGVWVQVEWD